MELPGFAFFVAGLVVSSTTTILLFHLFDISKRKRSDNLVERSSPTQKLASNLSENDAAKPASAVMHAKSDSNSPKSTSTSNCPNRIEEENVRALSSEYTRRGQLWSRHASWHLPRAPRMEASRQQFESYYLGTQGLDRVLSILQKYDVDMYTGFLPSKDPLQRLPYARYHIWEDLADDLPKLLGARSGQARDPLSQLPVLRTDKLITDAELRRAHLLLCLFAHAYVWGGPSPIDRIPEGIAKPLCEVSDRLHIPPVLGHPSIVLYNWRRLDAKGDICMENLATLNNFFDGRDESWFYLITVEIEAYGAPAIVPIMLAMDSIQRFNDEEASRRSIFDGQAANVKSHGQKYTLSQRSHSEEAGTCDSDGDNDEVIYTNEALVGTLNRWRVAAFVVAQLQHVKRATDAMTQSILNMREGCHPFIFYHRVRPFLSAWKHNPAMPKGVIYEGVSDVPKQFYGGSAAQSSLLPFLDIALGVTHDSNKSRDFLLAMRDYMLLPHREFLEYLESIANLRQFVQTQVADLESEVAKDLTAEERELLQQLRDAYDDTVKALQQFRSGHINLVAEYIIAQQRHGMPKGGSLEGSAGGRGTGGTELMSFLKPIRDDVVNKILKDEERAQAVVTTKDSEENANAVSTVEVLRQKTVATASLLNDTQVSTEPASGTNPVSTSNAANASNSMAPNKDVYYKDNGRFEDIDLFRNSNLANAAPSIFVNNNADS